MRPRGGIGAPAGEEALLVFEREDGRRLQRGGAGLLRRGERAHGGLQAIRRGEPVGDLVRDYDCAIVDPSQRAQQRAESNQLCRAMSKRRGRVGRVGFGAVVCGDGVDNAETGVVARQRDG